MNLARCISGVAAVGVVLSVGSVLAHAESSSQALNHIFDVNDAMAVACLEGATFSGEATAAGALGVLMTAEVWNSAGTILIATGNTNTFTNVNEVFTFTVPYPAGTFSVGDTIRLNVTESPGTFFSFGGDAGTARVADCVGVPTLPGWGIALFSLLLVAGGALMLGRQRKVLPISGP